MKALLKDFCCVEHDIPILGISNDSQSVQAGDLFLATTRDTEKRVAHMAEAIGRGAAAIVYEKSALLKPPQFKGASLPLLAVKNLQQWQGVIAARFYGHPSAELCNIGVTGTNGKTSCTHWMAEALNQLGISCGLIGTLGVGFPQALTATGYTTPDPLKLQKGLHLLRAQGASVVALEVSSHALDQHRLNGMQFDVAVLTQLSRDHLDYHGSLARYADTKAKLFQWPGLKTAIINIDDSFGKQWVQLLPKKCSVITYSLKKEADASIFPEHFESNRKGFFVKLRTPWGVGAFQSPFLGKFNLYNLMAVLAVLSHFHFSLQEALACFERLTPVPGRLEQFGGGVGQPIVVVDYAHTPDALEQALIALRQHCSGNLWCVFGCGGERDRGKRSQMAEISETCSDHVIVTSDNPRAESPQQIVNDIMAGFSVSGRVIVELDRGRAIAYAIRAAKKNDMVLIAGKGHESFQILGTRMIPFSDRNHVLAALAQRQ